MRSLLLVLALIAACKGDPEKCDQACRNYAQLVETKKMDAEIAAAPVEQRDALRKEKLAKFTANLEKGIDLCSSRCVTAGNSSQIDCLIEAKTAEQAKACVND